MNTNLMKDLEKLTGSALSLANTLWSIRTGDETSQVKFAKKIGVSRSFLCDLEHGRRRVSPKKAAEFARILGYSEKVFVSLCLQDILESDDLHYAVSISDAA